MAAWIREADGRAGRSQSQVTAASAALAAKNATRTVQDRRRRSILAEV
jgi:hypothetical protein